MLWIKWSNPDYGISAVNDTTNSCHLDGCASAVYTFYPFAAWTYLLCCSLETCLFKENDHIGGLIAIKYKYIVMNNEGIATEWSCCPTPPCCLAIAFDSNFAQVSIRCPYLDCQ